MGTSRDVPVLARSSANRSMAFSPALLLIRSLSLACTTKPGGRSCRDFLTPFTSE